MQKTVCQYLVSVLRNFWQKLYQIKNRPMLKSTFPILVLPDRKDVRDLRGWWANFGDKKQESQDESKEFGNLGR